MTNEKSTTNMKDILSESSKTIDPKDEPVIDEETLEKYRRHYRERFVFHGYDDREPHNITTMARYCAKYYAGAEKRGLCLMGEPGRGKTFAFKIMAKLFGKQSQLFPASDLVDKWRLYGVKGRSDFYEMLKGSAPCGSVYPQYDKFWRDCFIDDIGTEPTLNEFGTKGEVIDWVIQQRTRDFESSGAKTHLSLNGSIEDLEKRYGARFVSRVHQLCHIVIMKGVDRRKDK